MQARKRPQQFCAYSREDILKIETCLTLSCSSPRPFLVSSGPCRGVFKTPILKAPFSFGPSGAQGVECRRIYWSGIECEEVVKVKVVKVLSLSTLVPGLSALESEIDWEIVSGLYEYLWEVGVKLLFCIQKKFC